RRRPGAEAAGAGLSKRHHRLRRRGPSCTCLASSGVALGLTAKEEKRSGCHPITAASAPRNLDSTAALASTPGRCPCRGDREDVPKAESRADSGRPFAVTA